MKKNRYVILIDMYVYADDVDEAIEQGKKMCTEINDKHDSNASLIKDELHLANYGTKPEKVKK